MDQMRVMVARVVLRVAAARAMAMRKVVLQALVAQVMERKKAMPKRVMAKKVMAAAQAMVLKLPTRLTSLKCPSLLLKMCLGPVRRKKKSLKFSGRLGVYTIFGMGGLYILMFGVIFRIF